MISLPLILVAVLAVSAAVVASPVYAKHVPSKAYHGKHVPSKAHHGKHVHSKAHHGCKHKLQRKAWHTLSAHEKAEYLKAEVCLMHLPSQLKLSSTRTRFDDLVKPHQMQFDKLHHTGWFLPFHRLYLHTHERLLREECGYKGAQPYWDEARDAGNFAGSDIFDHVLGFGGNGNRHDGCITTGPFHDYKLSTGPNLQNTRHCIKRAINNKAGALGGPKYVNQCIANPNIDSYKTAWPCIENGPHAAGHVGVSGEMNFGPSAPGDPVFYMHHAWIDYMWARWQAADHKARIRDVSVPAGQSVVTLHDKLNMFGIIHDATVGDVMDIGGHLLCMEYV